LTDSSTGHPSAKPAHWVDANIHSIEVTAGVAAAILSYYPNLSAAQVREIIIKSGISYKKQKVVMPGDEEKKIKFGKLSKSGKVVNLYEALKLAEKMSK
jgi:hypothetical protein